MVTSAVKALIDQVAVNISLEAAATQALLKIVSSMTKEDTAALAKAVTDLAASASTLQAAIAALATPPVPTTFELGVHRGAQDKTMIVAYETWLGRRMDRILDTIPSDSWDNMVTNGWAWFAGQWAGYENRMVLTIPMIPTFGNYGSSSMDDTAASAALTDGANGKFDSYWVTMRQNLLSAGYGNAMIRLGWEMNGNWYNWRAHINPTAWVTYFKRIVSILRDDANVHFKINFNSTQGYVMIGAETLYPGDDYVDVIGLDIYDKDWDGSYQGTSQPTLTQQQEVWYRLKTYPQGLDFWSSFAKTHNKPFTIPEWGLWPYDQHGGGDNPYFIQQMHDYASDPANGVSQLLYFELPNMHALYDSASEPTLFPQSSALYKQLFGK